MITEKNTYFNKLIADYLYRTTTFVTELLTRTDFRSTI